VLGCVARLDPVKAHDVLIDAFARLVAAGRHDLELRLLGDGPCRPGLERLAHSRGLAGRVRFLGMAGDIPDQLRDLDLFVLPSRREGRPTSVMEAMAAGLAVVATRVGSVPELVSPGRTGLLAEPGDTEGLARALLTLIENEVLRSHYGEEARRVAVAELSLERMVEGYAAFYRAAAAPGRRASRPARCAGSGRPETGPRSAGCATSVTTYRRYPPPTPDSVNPQR
jgi:glycosyltransferase involved in cell wall biosynthesis